MIKSDEDALDPELAALLRADFAVPGAAVKERVSGRLAQTLGALAMSGGASVSPSALAPATGRSIFAALRAHPLGFIVSFSLGAAFGSGIYALTAHPEPRVVFVDRPAASVIASPPSAAIGTASSAPRAPDPTPSAVAAASASVGHSGPASLAEQQALLDLARAAFARSDYPATLSALSAHFRRYPKSVLGEEREALEIKTLASSGQTAQATARAQRFKQQFPQSLLLPSVVDSVGPIP